MRNESPRYLSHSRDAEASEALKWDGGGVLLDEALALRPVDFAAMFGNSRPVEIEIGTGKGTFLLERAKARPEMNFLGIEWAGAYARYAADRFRRHGLVNVRMLHADATKFIAKCVGDATVWRLHVYFPDPWPKQKHHRRRSIQAPFVEQVWRILQPGGELLIVTDHQDYYRHIQRVLANAKGFAQTEFPEMADSKGELVGTNFERKYIAEGRPFYRSARMKYV